MIRIKGLGSRVQIGRLLKENFNSSKCLVVTNYVSEKQKFDEVLAAESIGCVYFTEFKSNPAYEDVCKGVAIFNSEHCDTIVAIGGGSAIDVAKCIKLFSRLDTTENYLEQEYSDNGIPFAAIPTTAGTGSEATHFAVVYYEGKKFSVAHESLVPAITVLDAETLKELPVYQRKCTMLDALCQGIEAWWSVNSNETSKQFSASAVSMIVENMDDYVNHTDNLTAAQKIMEAANYAGRAINIAKTTAAHAMSYKITSVCNIPHGHAVALCFPKVWRFMLEHMDKVCDSRGSEYLAGVFAEIARCLKCATAGDAIAWFESVLEKYNINAPYVAIDDIKVLASSVNPQRLKNNPVAISENEFAELYTQIVRK